MNPEITPYVKSNLIVELAERQGVFLDDKYLISLLIQFHKYKEEELRCKDLADNAKSQLESEQNFARLKKVEELIEATRLLLEDQLIELVKETVIFQLDTDSEYTAPHGASVERLRISVTDSKSLFLVAVK